MSGTNVVAMPKTNGAPAAAPAAGTPSQQMYPPWGGPPWAMNPIYPIPPGPWSGMPGCAPPGCPPSSLMQCYCDIQNSMQFISAIMIDLINNNPAVAQAMIAAIEKSGSALPLIGVTNGSQAQPGQVGEFVQISVTVNYPITQNFNQTVTMGVLQPGDWDVWCYLSDFSPQPHDAEFSIVSTPPGSTVPGFSGGMGGANSGLAEFDVLSRPLQANISVPTLVAFSLTTNVSSAGTAAGACVMTFTARRRR